MRALLLILLTGVASACGDSIPDDLTTCDITTSGCQRGIFESVAERLGQESTSIPRIRTISVEEFAQEVRGGVDDDDLVGDDPETRGLRLIGFLPDTAQSATETAIELRIASIAAYYSSGSTSITVIDRDYQEGVAQEILAHEFVHALQDDRQGIRAIFSGAASTDAFLGRRLAIEGDATYAAADWFLAELDLMPTAEEWAAESARLQSFAIEDARDLDKSIDESAGFFPYAYGFELFGRAFELAGLEGRTQLLDSPPSTARDGMAGYDALLRDGFTQLDQPDEVLSDTVADSELALEDRAGAWYVYATLLRGGFSDDDAWAGALAWRGDVLGIFESGSEVVAVWRVRFNRDASFLADAIEQSPRDVFWTTVVDGNEAYVIAAESDAALATWEAQPLGTVAALVAAAPDVRKSAELRLPRGCVAPPARLH